MSTELPGGGPAYPSQVSEKRLDDATGAFVDLVVHHHGMTKLEVFAALASAGIVLGLMFREPLTTKTDRTWMVLRGDEIAAMAALQAESLLRAL